ncbi:MAG: bifunctional UDP-N-acetylglucosamine diphosphorylase/glucosamine-1-phosphate N-acetyltransferase GlmU [Pseudomonadota bacterium]
MPIEIVILAAGQGTRMRSTLPKVLHDLGGRPLLGHVMDTAAVLNPTRLCVVYGHGGDTVMSTFADRDATWVHQSEQRGTGHAVLQAAPHLSDEAVVLILFGDVPLVRSETLEAAAAIASQDKLAVVSAMVADPTGYGRVIRDANDSVVAIREHKDASSAELAIREINTGIMAAPVNRLRGWLEGLTNDNAQGEYYLTDAVEAALADGVAIEASVVLDEDEVSGVNDRVQLARLERAYQHREAERLMRAGVSLRDPTRFDVRGTVEAGTEVSIDVNVVLSGRVTLGTGVRIGPNCVVSDTNIGDGVEILANCVIESASIAAGARVGPFARVRPEADLGPDVHVGNFVEIKKSVLKRGAKVNHLTYIGDSEVGERVNVGAGTITCNYDGANKHRTTIEDDAFIGSGAMLVAPVTVGAGATIGAGSTISRDAPANELTVARGKQRSISGWQRPVKNKK